MSEDPQLLMKMLGLLLAIGGVAGILAGLLGVGGGIVLVAAFYYAFQTLGYDSPQLMQICLTTSLATRQSQTRRSQTIPLTRIPMIGLSAAVVRVVAFTRRAS